MYIIRLKNQCKNGNAAEIHLLRNENSPNRCLKSHSRVQIYAKTEDDDKRKNGFSFSPEREIEREREMAFGNVF